MPVVAMVVAAAQSHPNADSLRVYVLTAEEIGELQIVANMDHVYQEGDIVAVALIGTTLRDQTEIKRARLRGIDSFGMALGKVEASVGDDLSSDYCAEGSVGDAVGGSAPILKWPSIELLHNVRRGIEAQRELEGEAFRVPKITYRAKVKLHGTNAGIQLLPSGQVVAQGRNQILTPADDNAGFAAWVEKNEDYFSPLVDGEHHRTIYGEWCGAGIQKGVAIAGIGRKVFVVFAVQTGDHARGHATLQIEPAKLREWLPAHTDVFVLPWHGETFSLDFGDETQLRTEAERIEALVTKVADEDPWVAEVFDVAGTGEGVVLYPVDLSAQGEPIDRSRCSELMFKAKSEKHRVTKKKKAVQLDAEVLRSVELFVDHFATEARMEQAVSEACCGDYDMPKLGAFLKWLGGDIKKESAPELEASGLKWQQVAKAITTAGRGWYQRKTKGL